MPGVSPLAKDQRILFLLWLCQAPAPLRKNMFPYWQSGWVAGLCCPVPGHPSWAFCKDDVGVGTYIVPCYSPHF